MFSVSFLNMIEWHTKGKGEDEFTKWIWTDIISRDLTSFFTVDRAAMTQAAETLAIRVPNGNHFNNPILPNPRPLSLAKNHLIHTPKGPTMQANHSCASLLSLLNSSLSNTPLTLHRETSISKNTAKTTKWRLWLSTLQLVPELVIPHPELLSRSCLKPLAVSTPTMME